MNEAKENKFLGFFRELKKNRYVYLLALPGMLFLIVFHYLPMAGLVIAFQDFNAVKGITGSEFVGLENFRILVNSPSIGRVIYNTLFLNVLFIGFGMIFSIIIAVLLNEIGRKYFKKFTQTVLILPHFVSWTIAAMITIPFLASDGGMVNTVLELLGFETMSFYKTPEAWPPILVVMNIWKEAGFGSVIYLATITGIDSQVFEAAKIDGANRIKTIRYIILPLLKNTALLLLLLRVGKIFYGNFGLIYPMVAGNSLLYPTTDIIDTFVYRALMELGDMGMSTAVGLTQSVMGFIFVILTNTIVKKFNPESAIF